MEILIIAALTMQALITGFALALIVLKRSSANFVGDGSQEIEQINQRLRVSENRLDSMDRRLTDLSGRVG